MKKILFFLMMSIMLVGCLNSCSNGVKQTHYVTQYEILYPDSNVVYTDTIEGTEPPKVLKSFELRYLSVNNGFEIIHKIVTPNPIRIIYVKELK